MIVTLFFCDLIILSMLPMLCRDSNRFYVKVLVTECFVWIWYCCLWREAGETANERSQKFYRNKFIVRNSLL